MIREVSWELKIRQARASQYLIPRWVKYNAILLTQLQFLFIWLGTKSPQFYFLRITFLTKAVSGLGVPRLSRRMYYSQASNNQNTSLLFSMQRKTSLWNRVETKMSFYFCKNAKFRIFWRNFTLFRFQLNFRFHRPDISIFANKSKFFSKTANFSNCLSPLLLSYIYFRKNRPKISIFEKITGVFLFSQQIFAKMLKRKFLFLPSFDVLCLLGRNMLAAGYAVYGVSTLLVLASAGGAAVYQVHLFF